MPNVAGVFAGAGVSGAASHGNAAQHPTVARRGQVYGLSNLRPGEAAVLHFGIYVPRDEIDSTEPAAVTEL